MRSSLITALLASFALSPLAAQTSINFDDGTDGTAIAGFYSGLGVTFGNARWDGFVSPDEGLVGAGGLKLVSIINPFSNKSDAPIVATFASDISAFSIRGLNVGFNGARIDFFDGADVLLGSAESIYGGPDATGVANHPLLSFSAAGIRTAHLYQPLDVVTEGMLWDNMTFSSAATVVPEPSSLAMLALGIVGLVVARRRRRA